MVFSPSIARDPGCFSNQTVQTRIAGNNLLISVTCRYASSSHCSFSPYLITALLVEKTDQKIVALYQSRSMTVNLRQVSASASRTLGTGWAVSVLFSICYLSRVHQIVVELEGELAPVLSSQEAAGYRTYFYSCGLHWLPGPDRNYGS